MSDHKLCSVCGRTYENAFIGKDENGRYLCSACDEMMAAINGVDYECELGHIHDRYGLPGEREFGPCPNDPESPNAYPDE